MYLLGLQLYADESEHRAQDWVDIARWHIQVGDEAARNMILNICSKAYPDWSKLASFRFIYKNSMLKDKQKDDDRAFLVTKDGDSTVFDGKREPELVSIFEHVTTVFTLAHESLVLAAKAIEPDNAASLARSASATSWVQ